MGGVVGGIVGGVGSIIGGNQAASGAREGARQAVQQVQPFRDTGIQAQNALAGAFGLQGGDAQQQAFQNFLDTTGFQNELQAGQQAITGSAAARGLLNSGATARGLQEFGQNLAQRPLQNFLGGLQGIANQGLNAATFAGQSLNQGQIAAGQARAQGTQGLAEGIGFAGANALPSFGSIFG